MNIILIITICLLVIVTIILIWGGVTNWKFIPKKKENYSNCIIVTPAGRKRYLQKLVSALEKQEKDFDEWHLWENTRNENDKKYLYELEKNYPWIKVITRNEDDKKGTNSNIHKFFDYTINPGTIYIRLDDDILWLEDNFIKNLKKFREENPQYFLVFANIVNNQKCDYIHQQIGALPSSIPELENLCKGNLWKEETGKPICKEIHKAFIKARKNNTTDKWKFDKKVIDDYSRVSINAICWIGGSYNNFGKIVGEDEEQWLSSDYPKKIKTPCVIYGGALCVHFAFYTQRDDELEKMINEIADT